MRNGRTILLAAAMAWALGCSGLVVQPRAVPTEPLLETSLYERLGGIYPIAVVVDDFVDRLTANDVLNANPAIDAARQHVPAPGLKFGVTQLLAEATGGPQRYTGRSLLDSHRHMEITDAEWTVMVSDLLETLQTFDVPAREREELLAILEPTKDQVVVSEESISANGTSSYRAGHQGEEGSLYERLGGLYPIAIVIDDFMDRIYDNDILNGNPAVAEARARVPLPGLKYMVVEFVGASIGGPMEYTGRSMAVSHAPLGLGEEEWRALEGDLRESMNTFRVPLDLQEELLVVLRTLKSDILTG